MLFFFLDCSDNLALLTTSLLKPAFSMFPSLYLSPQSRHTAQTILLSFGFMNPTASWNLYLGVPLVSYNQHVQKTKLSTPHSPTPSLFLYQGSLAWGLVPSPNHRLRIGTDPLSPPHPFNQSVLLENIHPILAIPTAFYSNPGPHYLISGFRPTMSQLASHLPLCLTPIHHPLYSQTHPKHKSDWVASLVGFHCS